MEIKVKSEDIFPTRIYMVKLSHLDKYIPSWLEIIHKLEKSDMPRRGKSNRKGWNSQNILCSIKEFSPLFNLAQTLMSDILKNEGNHQYQISAWANVLNNGAYNVPHVHPGSLLSACYYLKTPVGSGEIVFHDPRPGIKLSILEKTPHHSSSMLNIKPEPGMFIIFPSWLEHSVKEHTGSEPRYSIAMNFSRI